jgi:hypothetical protein
MLDYDIWRYAMNFAGRIAANHHCGDLGVGGWNNNPIYEIWRGYFQVKGDTAWTFYIDIDYRLLVWSAGGDANKMGVGWEVSKLANASLIDIVFSTFNVTPQEGQAARILRMSASGLS